MNIKDKAVSGGGANIWYWVCSLTYHLSVTPLRAAKGFSHSPGKPKLNSIVEQHKSRLSEFAE